MRGLWFDARRADLAENLATQGLQLASLPVATETQIGKDALFQIAQISKECNSGSAICHQIGKCTMPKEGVFARVVRGALAITGDSMRVIGKTMKKEATGYATKSKCVKGIKGSMSSLSRRAFVNMVKQIGCSGGRSSSH